MYHHLYRTKYSALKKGNTIFTILYRNYDNGVALTRNRGRSAAGSPRFLPPFFSSLFHFCLASFVRSGCSLFSIYSHTLLTPHLPTLPLASSPQERRLRLASTEPPPTDRPSVVASPFRSPSAITTALSCFLDYNP